ncbi:hypothetical protein [Thermococcus sp. 21S7]|uniref:hypothetical protein n=1 Tax=Thermococcus sp. 21S7 TaxID=1638221 RepID=UPI00143B13F4|nr:hypothetical protein [Thermococcus sp. 21S7]NJE61900.1 hypothetical protein [Thermococcus sp. 21S7]
MREYSYLKSLRNTLMILSMFFSFISIYLGFRNHDKILAGLGLFTLSFWASWFDPVTKDISKKTGSTPKTFEEIFIDILTTALLSFILIYTFFFSSSEKVFFLGLIIVALMIVIVSRFYDLIRQHLTGLSSKGQSAMVAIPAVVGGISFLIFTNLGGTAALLGFLACTVLLLEFKEQKAEKQAISPASGNSSGAR